MKKILDKTDFGELWMENVSGLPVYHIDAADGTKRSTVRAADAKKYWQQINDSGAVKKKGKTLSRFE